MYAHSESAHKTNAHAYERNKKMMRKKETKMNTKCWRNQNKKSGENGKQMETYEIVHIKGKANEYAMCVYDSLREAIPCFAKPTRFLFLFASFDGHERMVDGWVLKLIFCIII